MEDVLTDDQSHYEISLTAGQAFVAFVLLLLSLAASFAFGLLIGRGQTDDRLAIRKDAAAITEANVGPTSVGRPAEAGPHTAPAQVTTDDFKEPAPKATIEAAGRVAAGASPAAEPAKAEPPASAAGLKPAAPPVTAPAGPVYAQLLSTSDQKTAEGLAAKLIEGGFKEAYVERTTTDKGTIFRVRVKFATDAEAHASEAKLKTFSKDVWITSK